MTVPLDFHMYRGDTATFDLIARNNINATLAGCKLYFTAKRSTSETDQHAVFRKTSTPANGITIVDPVAGTITVEIAPADTASLGDGTTTLVWDFQIIDGQSKVSTPLKGTLQVEADVTRSIA
jgi:hypothetical protein